MFMKWSIFLFIFGTFIFLNIISSSSADMFCTDGSWCSSPSYCCKFGDGCCTGTSLLTMEQIGYYIFQIIFAIVFLSVLILCCRCCCCPSQQGVVYQQGVVAQASVPTYQPPPTTGYPQQQLPPNVMYPAYQPMESPYQQQFPSNPYYPGAAPPPYSTLQFQPTVQTVPNPQPTA